MRSLEYVARGLPGENKRAEDNDCRHSPHLPFRDKDAYALSTWRCLALLGSPALQAAVRYLGTRQLSLPVLLHARPLLFSWHIRFQLSKIQ